MNKTGNESDRILKILVIAASVLLLGGAAGLFVFLRMPASQYHRNLNLGNKYLVVMQYDDAVNAFSRAIDIEPKKADAYVGRGDAYAGLKQDEKAQADYIKAVELDPELNDKIQEKISGLDITPTPTATPTPTITPTPTATPEPNDESHFMNVYAACLNEFKSAQDDGFNQEASGFKEKYPDVKIDASTLKVIGSTTDEIDYALCDLNDDSVPELLIGGFEGGYRTDVTKDVYQIFVICDDGVSQVNDLAGSGYRVFTNICEGNIIETCGGGRLCEYYKLKKHSTELEFLEGYRELGTQCSYVGSAGWDSGDETSITRDELYAAMDKYPVKTEIEWHKLSDYSGTDSSSGSQSSGTESASSSVQTASVSSGSGNVTTSGSVDDFVSVVRKNYNATNDGSYAENGGMTYNNGTLIKKVFQRGGNSTLDDAMDKAGYGSYSAEYYYTNQDVSSSINGYSGLIFVYLNIGGKEYRYYYDGYESLARKISSYGQEDYPKMDWFYKAVYDAG